MRDLDKIQSNRKKKEEINIIIKLLDTSFRSKSKNTRKLLGTY